MDHGGNRQHKIVGRRQRQQEKSSNEKGSEQGTRNSERVVKMKVLVDTGAQGSQVQGHEPDVPSQAW
jgi:hypothetical protein